MTRLQFLIVTSLSSLTAVCLILIVILAQVSQAEQIELARRQAAISHGEAAMSHLRTVARRVAEIGAQDQAMKDLLARQGITYNENDNPAATSAPASSSSSSR